MDKDRDISRSVTTITPKKVGFMGSAVLAGSALLAACEGGAKSATTPEGGVAGVAVQPGGGPSPIVVKTEAMPSATAVKEAPTVAPTPTVEAPILTVDELKANVNETYSGRTFSQLNRPQFATAAAFNNLLDTCSNDTATDISGASKASAACQRLGDGTLSIFKLTNDDFFWVLNQQLKVFAHGRMAELNKVIGNPDFEGLWKSVEQRYFSNLQ